MLVKQRHIVDSSFSYISYSYLYVFMYCDIFHSDSPDDSNGFIPQYNKPLPRYTYNSNSDSTILSPVERSRSLQYRNESFGPAGSTISYGSSIATRTASLLHTKPNNYSMPRGQMYNSASVVGYGAGSQYNTMDSRHWSPPIDFSQRVRKIYMQHMD